jgi:uncharacterized integral membrane protein
MQLTIIAAILTAVIGVAFAMQNNVPVTINFLVWRFDSSLAMALLLALALGAIAVALLTTPGTLKRQWRLSRQKRRIDELEKTCDDQRRHIADLETQLPEPQSTAKPSSYVGLKELITGRDNDAGQDTDTPSV